jgi:hypothetical protein
LKQHPQSDEEKYESFVQEIQDGSNFENPYSENMSVTHLSNLKKKSHGMQDKSTILLEIIEEKAS